MHALLALTVANIKSYTRDRAAVFWTLAFPLIFIVMFGLIFQGGGTAGINLGWVDEDGSAAAASLHMAFDEQQGTDLIDGDRDAASSNMRDGKVDAVIVVPAGYGDAVAAGTAGSAAPTSIIVYTDPSRSNLAASVYQVGRGVLGVVNLGGRPPLVAVQAETLQTEDLNFISYFVPSMLGLSVMQVGIFAAVPLVADREKLILKRLAATPLRRWQLVGSNVLMRLLIALVQSVIIVGVGVLFFGVEITGPLGPDRRVRRPRRGRVPGPRLRHRFVRHDRGRGQRDDQRRPVPDDVPVGDLLPDRGHARVPPDDRAAHPVDLPRRRAAPGHGRRGRVRAAVGLRRGPARLAGGLLRDRLAQVPLAVGGRGRLQRRFW